MEKSQWADPPQPTYSIPPSESFAQTGPQQDDLFDDIIPADEAMRLRSDEDLFNDDFTPIPEPVTEQVAPTSASQPQQTASPEIRGHGESSRGRGRGRGRGQASRGAANGDARTPAQVQAQTNAPESAPSGPRKETTFAVRGDRQATGGVKKPKLTEEELAEKLASMQIKNASAAAAHARAEADAAAFAEREQQAKQVAELKRKEERRDRQQMMGEREKNRQRKLKAMTGREWDAEKEEVDARPDARRGFGGDKDNYSDGREYMYRDPKASNRGKDRGSGRGGRGGLPEAPMPPKQEDFPALAPPVSKANEKPAASATSLEINTLPEASNGKSWAEQVESPAS